MRGAVAVGEKESAVGQERVVGGHEGVATPTLRRLGVLVLRVESRIHRRAFFPDQFALEREFGEILQLLIAGHVEKLLPPLSADFETVTAALKLIAERAHEPALAIEHKNRRMILQIGSSFVDHVQIATSIHSDVVRRLPRELAG